MGKINHNYLNVMQFVKYLKQLIDFGLKIHYYKKQEQF